MYLGNEWRCHISGRETESKEQYFVDTIAGYDAVSLFLEDNQELTEIADGEIYITAGSFARNDMHVGDTIRIQMKTQIRHFE